MISSIRIEGGGDKWDGVGEWKKTLEINCFEETKDHDALQNIVVGEGKGAIYYVINCLLHTILCN